MQDLRSSVGRYHLPVKVRRKSALHAITIADRGGVRTMEFDDVVQSTMRLDGVSDEGLEYADFFHLAFALRPIARALLIGLGGATVPKQWLADYPALAVDVVEIDAAVVELAQQYFAFGASERCRMHVADGASFVEESGASWDLIAVDAYTIVEHELAAPPQLITREFFRAALAHLETGGVLAFNAAAAPANVFTQKLRTTIAETFAHGLVFESSTSDNTVILASTAPLERRAEKLVQIARRDVASAVMERRALVRRARQLVGWW